MDDAVFDDFLAPELRAAVSDVYWTPLAVAARASHWLDEAGVRTVVDVGSGVGKFCVAAALHGRARYLGVEQRPRLLSAARELARTLGVDHRVSFTHGVFGRGPLPEADAYYFYNPFGENLFVPDDRLDDQVEVSEARYVREVIAAEEMLRATAVGTHVLTYNGFGGRMPASYASVRIDRKLPNTLQLWRKVRAHDAEPSP